MSFMAHEEELLTVLGRVSSKASHLSFIERNGQATPVSSVPPLPYRPFLLNWPFCLGLCPRLPDSPWSWIGTRTT